ncbi:MAG: LuxR C-terminal-related transcriptional regulator [Desulfohalobiaceae bacterium]
MSRDHTKGGRHPYPRDKAEEPESQCLDPNQARVVLDALSAHVAIVDHKGLILDTNRAWREFAHNNELPLRSDTLHLNYLDVCDRAAANGDDKAREVAEGIRSVIRGEVTEFATDYACHTPEQKRWFYLRAVRIPGSDPVRVVLTHENVTPLKQTEGELRQKSEDLKEANTALKVLLRQYKQEKADLEQRVASNVQELVLPYIARLYEAEDELSRRELLRIVESQLRNITTSFLNHLSSLHTMLTPQETQVASLVREGRSSKEIADLLNIEPSTVAYHRRNLRAKLGITDSRTSLYAHLSSLS